MRHNHSPLFRYGLPAAVFGLGALMLVPGNDAAPRASSVDDAPPRVTPSYVLASPDLVKRLDASLAPALTTETVVSREANLPEPAARAAAPSSRARLAARSASDRALLAEQIASDTDLLAGLNATDLLAPQRAAEDAAVELVADVLRVSTDPERALRVGDSAVNMRVGPSTNTGVIRTLRPGVGLAMGETLRGWVSVQTADGESGWVYSTYLTGPALGAAGTEQPVRRSEAVRQAEPVREAKQVRHTEQGRQAPEAGESRDTAASSATRYARVATDTQLRAGPSQGTERLFVVPAGERVTVAETRGGWVRVVHGGESGWFRVR